MMGTRLFTTPETRLGERVTGGFGVEAEGLFVVVKGGLTVDDLVDDAREGCLRSAERLAKEKVDASECRIEALLFRGSVV